MAAEPPEGLGASLSSLRPKDKEPRTASVLNGWVNQAEKHLGVDAAGGRLGWLIASTVVVAALQRAVDTSGASLFLLKGGTLLQHRLRQGSRATKDVDGLIRGDIDAFIAALDEVLVLPWGPLDLRRGEVTVIRTPARVVKPRRFDGLVLLRGVTWRRVQVEIAPDEGGAGDEPETFAVPTLAGFGLPDPDALVGLALRYQIAQKFHACSDPHDPPDAPNTRARDVVDLLLLLELTVSAGSPTLAQIRQACEAIFVARAADATQLGRSERHWPPLIVAHPHWAGDYAAAAASGGLSATLDEAVATANAWIAAIAAAQ